VVNTVVVWLYILGPYWCMYVSVDSVESTAEQCNIHKPIRA